ncbi:IclR family transcriptional regulator [Microbacterium sp.]|uniref:IclR family transcriptional regulator n=1 Tax=Microbacterium sp. TaxID=51671 RepID=UPI003C7064E4
MIQPKVPAADQTLRILRLLAAARGPLPAGVIATRLDLPRSTVYHLLATLQEHGFVLHLDEERRYGLGVAAFELSSAYLRQEPLARIGRPLMAALVDRVGLSGHFAVPHGRDVLYVVEERAKGAPALITDVDVRLPMHITASGRAILAALPKGQVRALYPDRNAFVRADARADQLRTDAGAPDAGTDDPTEAVGGAGEDGRERAIDRYSALRAVLDETTARGFAVEHGSVTAGISSVSVAVLDHRALPVAAVAVTFSDRQVPEERYPQLALEVRETARRASARLYGVRATP